MIERKCAQLCLLHSNIRYLVVGVNSDKAAQRLVGGVGNMYQTIIWSLSSPREDFITKAPETIVKKGYKKLEKDFFMFIICEKSPFLLSYWYCSTSVVIPRPLKYRVPVIPALLWSGPDVKVGVASENLCNQLEQKEEEKD